MRNLILLLSIFLVQFALAQSNPSDKKLRFWVGPQASVAAVDLAKTHSFGVGVHSQVSYKVAPKLDLLGNLQYSYFFGKERDGYTEPGGGGSYGGGKYDGRNDVNITGGVRYNFTDQVFGDVSGGVCMGFSDGLSESSLFGLTQVGMVFGTNSRHYQAVALFFGLCGDPKVQIGMRYSIGL